MNDDFDRELRREFQATFSDSTDSAAAFQTLQELGPEMSQARRRRQVITGVSSALVALVLVVGIGAAIQPSNGVQPVQVAQDGGQPASPTPPDTANPADADASVTEKGSSTTAAAGSAATHPEQASDAATPGRAAVTTTAVSAITPTTSGPAPTSTILPAPTTSTPEPTSSTTAPSTTVSEPAPTTTITTETIISSQCGSITVAISSDSIILLDVDPNPGMAVDRKNEGPESVEVSFEGPSGHCEIEAEIKNGVLDAEDTFEPAS